MHTLIRGFALPLIALGMLAGSPGVALGAEAVDIAHVEAEDGQVRLLVSVPEGTEVDLAGIQVNIAGEPATATSELAGTSQTVVQRTTILAVDTSNSMRKRGRFDAAKLAATTFLDTVPEDVSVGIVTFDSDVATALEPTQDREEAKAVIDGLELALETRLNDGVIQAVDVAGDEGQRSVLVLSDGRDTSDTPTEDVTSAITDAKVQVDVVALDQSGAALIPLEQMSEAGGGDVISSDPEALTAAFAKEASSLARQIQVTATLPSGLAATEATVEVVLPVGESELRASTFAVVQEAGIGLPPIADPDNAFQISKNAMYGGVAALGLGVAVILLFGVMAITARSQPATMEQRIAAYGAGATGSASMESTATLDQAKDAAASVLRHNRGLEARIEQRLEAAGSSFKPAEWLLLHSSIALLSALAGMLISSGSLPVAILFLALGIVVPWFWLGRKRNKRIKAFNTGLADTLQLISGSLSAGMSLAQAIDAVVREGNEPIAGEFKRVLIETRLGVSIEDALAGIGERVESVDFKWVVMAIRIQREVGGNLAELLTTVAATLRERDYLRRQVKSLSAEGLLSAYILGGMPPALFVWLLMTRRDYISPLFTEPLGWMFLAAGVFLLTMGGLMMRKIVKVEV